MEAGYVGFHAVVWHFSGTLSKASMMRVNGDVWSWVK